MSENACMGNAALDVDSLATAALVTVPEPGMTLSLLAGTVFLFLSNAWGRHDTH
jgi:hypothetical protein